MILYLSKMIIVYFMFCVPVQKNLNHVAKLRSCSRPQSSIVRQLLHKLWKPIFKRYNVRMNRHCPLHVNRDLFSSQEQNKLYYRADFWRCRICGKAFHKHVYLDLHMARMHDDILLENDDSVCLANYCDIFRCKNYLPHSDETLTDADLDRLIDTKELDAIYPDSPEKAGGTTYLIPLQPPELLDILELENLRKGLQPRLRGKRKKKDPDSSEDDVDDGGDEKLSVRQRNKSKKDDKDVGTDIEERFRGTQKRGFRDEIRQLFRSVEELVEAAKQEPELDKEHIWLLPDDEDAEECDPEEMEEMQNNCQNLLAQCISPLALQMTSIDFKNMEARLNRTLCWYLTCDRYYWHLPTGADSNSHMRDRGFRIDGVITWGFFLLLFLALGFLLAFIYYLVWICF